MKKKRFQLTWMELLFVAAVLALSALRCYQYLRIIEPGTGFYLQKDFSVYVLYGILLAFILLFFLVPLWKRGEYYFAGGTDGEKHPLLAVVCFLFAVGLACSAVASIAYVRQIEPAESAMDRLIRSGALPRIFEAVSAVISAVYAILLGKGYLQGDQSGSRYKLLALFPVVWAIARMIFRFTRTISFVNVSDLFLELVMLVFVLLFLMAFVQLNSRVNDAGIAWKLPAYGYTAALLALTCFLPRAVMLILGKGEYLAQQSPLEYCDFAFALFALGILQSHVKVSKEDPAKKVDVSQVQQDKISAEIQEAVAEDFSVE